MTVTISVIIMLIITGAIGFVLGTFLGKGKVKKLVTEARQKAEQIIAEAQKDVEIRAKEAELKAKGEWLAAKEEFERSTTQKRSELERYERKLEEQRRTLNKKADMLRQRERSIDKYHSSLQAKERSLSHKEQELNDLIRKQNSQLERIAGMTAEDAKQLLMANLEAQAHAEASQRIKEIKEEAEMKAEREANQVIISAIQRLAADTTVESTVSVVSLPNDDIKGRIIGREGRNIRAFETATGVDVIVDDTPEAIILSAFDPIRREIARIAMEKLILDGRIHPSRIEEMVKKAESELDVIIKEAGEQAAFDVGVHGIHPELIKLLGKLKYRTSYSQNVLQHSKEVALLTGHIAAQFDIDVNLAKRAGLLHDIGKAIDQGREGTHTQLGYEIAKKFGENEVVLNAIQGHHEDVEAISPITVLVQGADAISGSRPGARRESLENYIKRLQKLEQLADSFQGVTNTYAIQAGREIRVIVEPDKVNDRDSSLLATEIAQKIQDEMEYPGQIKVTVIRETRAVDYAK